METAGADNRSLGFRGEYLVCPLVAMVGEDSEVTL